MPLKNDVGIVRSQPPRRWSRRAFLRWTLGAGLATAAVGAGSVGYAFALEPDWLAVERVVVRVSELPPALDGLTVAHLSDFHWGPYTAQREVRTAVEKANALSPDLIVLTGDYVLYSAEYALPCARELADLQAPPGVVAIPGNHDYWTDIEVVTASPHCRADPADLDPCTLRRGQVRRPAAFDLWRRCPATVPPLRTVRVPPGLLPGPLVVCWDRYLARTPFCR